MICVLAGVVVQGEVALYPLESNGERGVSWLGIHFTTFCSSFGSFLAEGNLKSLPQLNKLMPTQPHTHTLLHLLTHTPASTHTNTHMLIRV